MRNLWFAANGIALLTLFAPTVISAEDKAKPKSVVLKDFDQSRQVFSFKSGKLVDPKAAGELGYDLMLDLPHGLGANNSKLDSMFKGQGGIIDMGKKSLDAVKTAPAKNYVPALRPKEIQQGHTYCVRTADGKNYGKFHVVKLDSKAQTLEITWAYPVKGMK